MRFLNFNSFLIVFLLSITGVWARTPQVLEVQKYNPASLRSNPVSLAPTLRATIEAAKNVDPEAYAQFREELKVIGESCKEAPRIINKIQNGEAGLTTKKEYELNKVIVQNMSDNISRALENLIKRIEQSSDIEGLCLESFFGMNFLKFSKKEGLDYLNSILADLKKPDYANCSSKLDALLGEVN